MMRLEGQGAQGPGRQSQPDGQEGGHPPSRPSSARPSLATFRPQPSGRLRVGDSTRHTQNGQPVLGHPGGQILHLHACSTSLPDPAGKSRVGRAHRKNCHSLKQTFHRYPKKTRNQLTTSIEHRQSRNHHQSIHPKCANQHRRQSRPDKPQSDQIQEMDFLH